MEVEDLIITFLILELKVAITLVFVVVVLTENESSDFTKARLKVRVEMLSFEFFRNILQEDVVLLLSNEFILVVGTRNNDFLLEDLNMVHVADSILSTFDILVDDTGRVFLSVVIHFL